MVSHLLVSALVLLLIVEKGTVSDEAMLSQLLLHKPLFEVDDAVLEQLLHLALEESSLKLEDGLPVLEPPLLELLASDLSIVDVDGPHLLQNGLDLLLSVGAGSDLNELRNLLHLQPHQPLFLLEVVALHHYLLLLLQRDLGREGEVEDEVVLGAEVEQVLVLVLKLLLSVAVVADVLELPGHLLGPGQLPGLRPLRLLCHILRQSLLEVLPVNGNLSLVVDLVGELGEQQPVVCLKLLLLGQELLQVLVVLRHLGQLVVPAR
mmetsp:Transcript_3467/g.5900  ORF Transcript_3467/g.5900 Transcript_3467/m.5900 type:complete len:263 (+) Transcript_3467:331-1119(+)